MACKEAEIGLRTYRRWRTGDTVHADLRPLSQRPVPHNKLAEHECQEILTVCNLSEYEHLPPTQIVPSLLDLGRYIASESSFYRVIKRAGQVQYRGRSKARKRVSAPTTFTATGANQVWSVDITYLPSRVRGVYYYLYVFEDIYSRKIVGFDVYGEESGEHLSNLLQRAVLLERCSSKPLVLHSDNGAPMKSQTMIIKLAELGVLPSYSRPRLSNDNAYVESLFKTTKYNHRWPSEGFESLSTARRWVQRFVHWYNNEHKHSKLNFVTPQECHEGLDGNILAK